MAIQTYIGCPLASFMVALEAKERSLQGPVRRVATCVFGRDTEFSWNFGNPMMRTKLQNGNNLSILAGRLIFVGVSGFLALLQAVQRTCKRVGDFFFWGKATKDGFPTPQKSHGFSFPPPPIFDAGQSLCRSFSDFLSIFAQVFLPNSPAKPPCSFS